MNALYAGLEKTILNRKTDKLIKINYSKIKGEYFFHTCRHNTIGCVSVGIVRNALFSCIFISIYITVKLSIIFFTVFILCV